MKRISHLLLPSIVLSLLSIVGGCSGEKVFTITFEAGNGAHFLDNQTTKKIQVKQGKQIAFPTVPIKEGNTFESAYAFKDWGVKNLPVATKDETFTATFENEKTDNCTYPQTLVTDSAIVNALDAIDTKDYRGYKMYKGKRYYEFVSVQNYTSDSKQIVHKGDKDYYEVEKISWKILTPSKFTNDTNLVVSEKVLDVRPFKSNVSSFERPYPNNYKESDIRSWMNDVGNFEGNSFLSRAFIDSSFIPTVEVDNSTKTTGYAEDNPYACENTFDKVFSLSYMDYNNIYFDFKNAYAFTTDFARARGTDVYTGEKTQYHNCGCFWTRSPHNLGYNEAVFVDYSGYMHSIITNMNYGARPALNIPK